VSTDHPADRGPSAQTGADSRQSKTNPADHHIRRHGPCTDDISNLPLTKRDGVELRADVLDTHMNGVDAVTVDEARRRWRAYVDESRDTGVVFENMATGDRITGSNPNRFHPDYTDQQYAKTKDLERGLRAEYGKRLHTAMLTFTASSTDDNGDPVPIVDHLDGPEGVLSSWSAVTRELRRVMDEFGLRYERLAILEPHKSGYIHVHMAVFVDGIIAPSMFESVIDAHVRNCERASEDAHDVSDDSTVSVKHVGADRSEDTIGNLGTYLTEYLAPYDDNGDKVDVLDAEDHIQIANTILWATGKQRWRPSNGAQSYMSRNESDEPSDWELVGIEDADGTVHELEPGESGGVDRGRTRTDDPGWGPPSKRESWGDLAEDRGGGLRVDPDRGPWTD